MNPDDPCLRVLKLARLPARMSADEVAAYLGFKPYDVPKLVRCGLLHPLGSTGSNSVKFFASAEVLKCADDRDWLDKATKAAKERTVGSKTSKNRRDTQAAA